MLPGFPSFVFFPSSSLLMTAPVLGQTTKFASCLNESIFMPRPCLTHLSFSTPNCSYSGVEEPWQLKHFASKTCLIWVRYFTSSAKETDVQRTKPTSKMTDHKVLFIGSSFFSGDIQMIKRYREIESQS